MKKAWRRRNWKKAYQYRRTARLAGKPGGYATREKYLAYQKRYREAHRDELARKAREMRPDLKILLASGYPMSALPSEGLGAGTSFISKPYRWTELAEKLRILRTAGP